MRCTPDATVMRSCWHKAVVGLAAGVLLGCTTPPGTVVPPQPLVVATTPPVLARSPSDVIAADTNTHVQAPPVPSAAPVAAHAYPTQRGRTSWYGKKFNGRRTASGERFDAMALTAAHRTLPLLSYARVRVVGSGKEVVVRINDRGPFHKGRVLDVSYAAARQLGIVKRGSALVDITPLAADEVPGNADIYGVNPQGAP
jgi:rare lipoprotein A